MIRWFKKASGEMVLQMNEHCTGNTWHDVPVIVERGEEPKCIHVWDGLVYTTIPPKYRCIKCSEYFYRTSEMEKAEARKREPREWWITESGFARPHPDPLGAKPASTWIKVREVIECEHDWGKLEGYPYVKCRKCGADMAEAQK